MLLVNVDDVHASEVLSRQARPLLCWRAMSSLCMLSSGKVATCCHAGIQGLLAACWAVH